MKFFILCVVTLVLSIVCYFLGAPKWSIKLSGGFFIYHLLLTVLGYWKGCELLEKYIFN